MLFSVLIMYIYSGMLRIIFVCPKGQEPPQPVSLLFPWLTCVRPSSRQPNQPTSNFLPGSGLHGRFTRGKPQVSHFQISDAKNRYPLVVVYYFVRFGLPAHEFLTHAPRVVKTYTIAFYQPLSLPRHHEFLPCLHPLWRHSFGFSTSLDLVLPAFQLKFPPEKSYFTASGKIWEYMPVLTCGPPSSLLGRLNHFTHAITTASSFPPRLWYRVPRFLWSRASQGSAQ